MLIESGNWSHSQPDCGLILTRSSRGGQSKVWPILAGPREEPRNSSPACVECQFHDAAGDALPAFFDIGIAPPHQVVITLLQADTHRYNVICGWPGRVHTRRCGRFQILYAVVVITRATADISFFNGGGRLAAPARLAMAACLASSSRICSMILRVRASSAGRRAR